MKANLPNCIFFACFCLPVFLAAQNCNCPEQFRFLTQKIAGNYAGFQDKVNRQTEEDFKQHTSRYTSLVQTASADTACLRLMSEWMGWFRDKHLYFSQNEVEVSPEEVRARFADWETIAMTEAEAKARFDQPGLATVEGIWSDETGNYKVAILKKENDRRDFAAVVLQADSVWWMPGQVKFELKNTGEAGAFDVRYFMRDHSERSFSGALESGILQINEIGKWVKTYPATGAGALPENPQRYRLEKLDDKTLLIVMTTMDEQFWREFKGLMEANKTLLESTPHLIIDVRGNGGGSDITFRPLQKYLYTKPVILDGNKYYCTEDNIGKFRRLATDENLPKSARRQVKKLARKMEKKQGSFWGRRDTYTRKYRKVMPYPQKVAILTDGGCGSSCEQLVLFAKQSDKVTLMGQNTGGVLDYGNLNNLPLPCGLWTIWYPTSRSGRVDKGQSIDNTGIPPAVRLDENTKDWVEFAKEYLKK